MHKSLLFLPHALPFSTPPESHGQTGTPDWEWKLHGSKSRNHIEIPQQEWVYLFIGYFPTEGNVYEITNIIRIFLGMRRKHMIKGLLVKDKPGRWALFGGNFPWISHIWISCKQRLWLPSSLTVFSKKFYPIKHPRMNMLEQRKSISLGGTWVVQPVEPPTLGFGSGHDLRVVRSGHTLGSMLSTESA